MKKLLKKTLSLVLVLALTASLAACGSASGGAAAAPAGGAEQAAASGGTGAGSATGEKIVNIGVTDTLGTLNPLNMDYAFINLYATSLMFLPLAGFTEDMGYEGFIAESISTEDNKVFDVKLRDDAVWSDGEPVVADDVIFTFLRMTCPEVANFNYDFSMFEGFGDDGSSPSGAESIDGIVKVDDKNLQFKLKGHMNLNTFINNVATWICILPSHVLKDIPAGELLSNDWFNHPDVVDGPFKLDDYDPAHYISYSANDKYFKDRPKIDKLNFRVVQGSELLAGLKSGEIDFLQPSISAVPVEDHAEIESMEGVTASYAPPVTNEMTYINTRKITDKRVRQAIAYAIDRETLLNSLLGGNGEIADGVIPSASPFYDENGTKISYDPEKAKQLLSEAGWDGSQTISYYVGSNDEVVVRAAQVVEQNLEAVGINVEIRTVDFATLMEVGGSDEVDMFSVQYTITPNDYYADLLTLADTEGESWTGGFFSEKLDKALQATQETTDEAELTKLFREVNEVIVDEVPLFSLYFLSNIGAVNDRLVNAKPILYGAFNNIHEWDVKV
ncbi:MAG: peptide ABC transporter substrate-binding protein [Lachnospiraceae bacterium]|nr:peptide ABC transporter substrate-binding protein [Lachnospiraceae bacterium]